MFGPNYEFCEQTWFENKEKISKCVDSGDRVSNEGLNLVVCDHYAYPQYELLPLALRPEKISDIDILDAFHKKKKKRKKHSVKKQLLQDEAILSGLQTVIDLCGLLDKCDLKTGEDAKIILKPKMTKSDQNEVDKSKSNSSCECKSRRSVSIKVNKLSPHHAVLAHVPQKQHSGKKLLPRDKYKSNIPKPVRKSKMSSKRIPSNNMKIEKPSPYFQNIMAYNVDDKQKVDKKKSDKDVKGKDSKDSKKTSGSNLSISCIPPVHIPACDTSCTECKQLEKLLTDFKKKHNKACECSILKSKNNKSKSECMRENPTKLFIPERSCSEQHGIILTKKRLTLKRSRHSIPCVQPVLGTCSEGQCNPFGIIEEVQSIRYAYVKITEFTTYYTYEVMKGTPKKPHYMPTLIKELFVTRKPEYHKKEQEDDKGKKKKKKADSHPQAKKSSSEMSNKSNKGVTFSNDNCRGAKCAK